MTQMIFFDFNPFSSFNFKIDEFLRIMINIFITFYGYAKYLFATIFLVIGILIFYKKFYLRNRIKKFKDYNYHVLVPEVIVALVYIVVAFGLYFNFIIALILNLAELAPPPMIFDILSLFDFFDLSNMIFPQSQEWEYLTIYEQLSILIIGTFSLTGFLTLLFGILIFIDKDLKGKKSGFKWIILGFFKVLILGVSPGFSLLLIVPI